MDKRCPIKKRSRRRLPPQLLLSSKYAVRTDWCHFARQQCAAPGASSLHIVLALFKDLVIFIVIIVQCQRRTAMPWLSGMARGGHSNKGDHCPTIHPFKRRQLVSICLPKELDVHSGPGEKSKLLWIKAPISINSPLLSQRHAKVSYGAKEETKDFNWTNR